MNLITLLKAIWVFAAALLMSFIGSLIWPESGLSFVFAIATVGAILTFLIERKKADGTDKKNSNENDSDKKD